MKFRPYRSPAEPKSSRRSATHEIVLDRRSAYLMTQQSRTAFEHHISPVAEWRDCAPRGDDSSPRIVLLSGLVILAAEDDDVKVPVRLDADIELIADRFFGRAAPCGT
jgi:hypothetical protein